MTNASYQVIGISSQVHEVVAPQINQMLAKDMHEVNYGENTQIICPIQGFPEPIYRWLKDGAEYNGIGNLTKILGFPRIISEDKGIYTCKARNRAGSQEFSTVFKVFPFYGF